jgi:hypothetical protein
MMTSLFILEFVIIKIKKTLVHNLREVMIIIIILKIFSRLPKENEMYFLLYVV